MTEQESSDLIGGKHYGQPTPVGQKFINGADLWREQHGYPAKMPLEAQDSTWREAGFKFGTEIVAVDPNSQALLKI